MALVPHRHTRGQQGLGEQVSLGTASRHGVATLASASEAETKAKQPPGPRIQNNHIVNSLFDSDTVYPAAQQGHNRQAAALNGTGSDWLYNKTPTHWSRYCPLYTSGSTNDFNTHLNNYFLRARKKDDEFADIAERHQPGDPDVGVNNTNKTYEIGPNQPRILGLYGSTGHFNSRNDNNGDNDDGTNTTARSWLDTSLYAMTINGIFYDNYGHSDGNGWIKHSYYQTIAIPTNAVKARYGAYVQCPADDAFNTNNFGAIEALQSYVAGDHYNTIQHNRYVRADRVRISPSGSIVSSQALNYEINSALNNTQYTYTVQNFSGIAPSNQPNAALNHPNDFLWPSHIEATGVDYTDSDYRDFKLVEREYSLKTSSGQSGTLDAQLQRLKLELIFYENSANIATASGSGTASGSIRFYAPYVQFLDSSDNVIAP